MSPDEDAAPDAHVPTIGLRSFAPRLLWIDCTAAALVGTLVVVLGGWLSHLYALPRSLLLATGGVNLAYATYSFSLAVRTRRRMVWIRLLVVANLCWAAVCLVLTLLFLGSASVFGLAHLIGEAVFVGLLARLEWRWRHLLGTPRKDGRSAPARDRKTASLEGPVTLRETQDADGIRRLTAELEGGDLVIKGWDHGNGVERFFGHREYEWVWTVKAGDVPGLRKALGDPPDLTAALEHEFGAEAAAGLQPFLDSHKIPYEAWSRVGD